MCNALNHSEWCRCGFGGEGHLGKSFGGGGSVTRHYSRPGDSKVEPQYTYLSGTVVWSAKCPVCAEAVFFYQNHNGSAVFFDSLGPPWPKHHCTDNGRDVGSKLERADRRLAPSNQVSKVALGGQQLRTESTFLSEAKVNELLNNSCSAALIDSTPREIATIYYLIIFNDKKEGRELAFVTNKHTSALLAQAENIFYKELGPNEFEVYVFSEITLQFVTWNLTNKIGCYQKAKAKFSAPDKLEIVFKDPPKKIVSKYANDSPYLKPTKRKT